MVNDNQVREAFEEVKKIVDKCARGYGPCKAMGVSIDHMIREEPLAPNSYRNLVVLMIDDGFTTKQAGAVLAGFIWGDVLDKYTSGNLGKDLIIKIEATDATSINKKNGVIDVYN